MKEESYHRRIRRGTGFAAGIAVLSPVLLITSCSDDSGDTELHLLLPERITMLPKNTRADMDTTPLVQLYDIIANQNLFYVAQQGDRYTLFADETPQPFSGKTFTFGSEVFQLSKKWLRAEYTLSGQDLACGEITCDITITLVPVTEKNSDPVALISSRRVTTDGPAETFYHFAHNVARNPASVSVNYGWQTLHDYLILSDSRSVMTRSPADAEKYRGLYHLAGCDVHYDYQTDYGVTGDVYLCQGNDGVIPAREAVTAEMKAIDYPGPLMLTEDMQGRKRLAGEARDPAPDQPERLFITLDITALDKEFDIAEEADRLQRIAKRSQLPAGENRSVMLNALKPIPGYHPAVWPLSGEKDMAARLQKNIAARIAAIRGQSHKPFAELIQSPAELMTEHGHRIALAVLDNPDKLSAEAVRARYLKEKVTEGRIHRFGEDIVYVSYQEEKTVDMLERIRAADPHYRQFNTEKPPEYSRKYHLVNVVLSGDKIYLFDISTVASRPVVLLMVRNMLMAALPDMMAASPETLPEPPAE